VKHSISILCPVLNEQLSLEPLATELLKMLEANQIEGEVIFIDDGSVDGTWETINTLSEAHPEIRGVRLQRNYGKSSALAAGTVASRYPVIVTIDGDLQDDPAEIPGMVAELDRGFDLVSGWKQNRQDVWHRLLASKIFNGTVSRVTGVRLHDHNCGLKAARREVYDSLSLSGGMHRFIPVLAASNGFRVTERAISHRPRKHGRSRYGLERVPRGFWDLLTVCFVTVHRERMQFMLGLTGAVSFLAGTGGLIWMAVYWVLRMSGVVEGPPVHDRPVVWYSLGGMLAGLQILVMGFLAELIVQRTQTKSDGYLISGESRPYDQSSNQSDAGRHSRIG